MLDFGNSYFQRKSLAALVLYKSPPVIKEIQEAHSLLYLFAARVFFCKKPVKGHSTESFLFGFLNFYIDEG